MKNSKSNVMLLITALIWGSAFVAQRIGMDSVGPWTFNCTRNLIGGGTLLAVMPFLDRARKQENATWNDPILWRGGLACGGALACASMLQQVGILYTTVGKAGFITSLYVILVPIFSIFLGKKVRGLVWFSAGLAAVGLYFLSITSSFSLSLGDSYVLMAAVLFAGHIMIIDHFSPKVDGVRLSCLQFLFAGVVCFLPMMVFEHPSLGALGSASLSILYAGVLSSGVGYTFQILGQKDADPTTASLILSLESVFAALTGFLILKQVLSLREILGCIIMFTAIIIAQLPEKNSSNK